MAGYGWNLTQVPKRPYNPSQIACRICNHVFMSTQALISHIETHMGDDNSGSRRQSLISYQRNNPYNTNQSSSSTTTTTCSIPPNLLSFSQNSYNLPSLQEIRDNPMLSGHSPRPIISPHPPLSLLATRNANHPSLGSQLQISVALSQRNNNKAMDEHNDCTKPFIQQLEKPYSSKIEIKGDNKSDLDMLDLTLKL